MTKLSRLALTAGLLMCGFAGTAAHAAELSAPARDALQAALEDEHRAEAFYAAVIDKFGAVRPFSNIIEAERKHAAELGIVMSSYGLETGQNPYLGKAEIVASVPATLAEACAMGVDAEIANRELYDGKLMPAAAGYDDIRAVFVNLRDASENKHLPAFQRCGGNGGGQGIGHGRNATKP